VFFRGAVVRSFASLLWRNSGHFRDRAGRWGLDEVFSERDANASTFFHGTVTADGFRIDEANLEHLWHHTGDTRVHCQSCFAKWHRSGDCYHKVLLAGGGEFVRTERCRITYELLKDVLLERTASGGGLV
jgi:hypothetical protein